MRKITGLLAASVLFVAACGDDDDDTAGGVQNDAADELVQQMEDEDIDADESCVREAFADMSDEDAQKIVDAGSDETPDLSPEGLAIATQATTSCVSGEDLLDSFIESLPEIKVPTMVLIGENDQPFIGASQYMATKIPGAKLVTIPGAGHAANIDQPAAFNDAVRAFLAETVGAPAR